MKARVSEKLRKLLSHPEKARALQKALVTPRRLDPQLRANLMRASLACRAESMRINKEFSKIEGDVENDW